MLSVERRGAALHVRLNRPDVRNALNGELIGALHARVSAVGDGVRVLVLSGDGPVFCAGADLHWMRGAAGWTREQHRRDAERLFDMLHALDTCAVPTLARVHGAALGGGMGLLAACDVVVAAEATQLGFTEAKLGLLPAVIAPFCIAKIGASHARALFATGERFDAARGREIGLIHRVVSDDQLDAAVDAVVNELLTSAPTAIAAARELVRGVAGQSPDAVRDFVADLNAARRTSDEGREGMSAFLEKRRPSWVEA